MWFKVPWIVIIFRLFQDTVWSDMCKVDRDAYPGDCFDNGFHFPVYWVVPLTISGGGSHLPSSGNSWKAEPAMAVHPQASLIQSECPITSLRKSCWTNSMWKMNATLHTAWDSSQTSFFPFSARLVFGYTSFSEIFIGQITVLNEQMGET